MSRSRGYLTLAARDPLYLEMAVDMALSLRHHTELPIALAADEALGALAQTRYQRVFDFVTLIPQRFRQGRALKYGVAEASPFEETMFVDADCIVLASMDDRFASLAHHDMAMTGEMLTPADDRRHHGFATRSLIRRFGLERYLKTNSGLFCFRRSAALQIMEECRACHVEEIVPRLKWSVVFGKWLGDELALGVVGGRRGLGTLPKPDAMFWPPEEFEGLDLARPSKPLLHLIWPLSPPTLDQLVRGTTARRAAAGIPGDAESHWRSESRKLEGVALRLRFLQAMSLYE
jgi:hypothetical protein